MTWTALIKEIQALLAGTLSTALEVRIENGMQDAEVVYTIVINSTKYMSQRGYDRRLLARGRETESTMHDNPDHGWAKVERKTEKQSWRIKKSRVNALFFMANLEIELASRALPVAATSAHPTADVEEYGPQGP